MMANDIQRWILSESWAWDPTIESGAGSAGWILDNWSKYEPGPGHWERTILMRAPAGSRGRWLSAAAGDLYLWCCIQLSLCWMGVSAASRVTQRSVASTLGPPVVVVDQSYIKQRQLWKSAIMKKIAVTFQKIRHQTCPQANSNYKTSSMQTEWPHSLNG